jgi:hypothetical protein
VTGVTGGVVTTRLIHAFTPGSVFQFQGLQSPTGVQNGVPYYVVDVPATNQFTFAAAPGGAALTASSANPQAAGQDFLNFQQTTLSGTVFNDANQNRPSRPRRGGPPRRSSGRHRPRPAEPGSADHGRERLLARCFRPARRL